MKIPKTVHYMPTIANLPELIIEVTYFKKAEGDRCAFSSAGTVGGKPKMMP